MSLFLDEDSRDIISSKTSDIMPVNELTDHGYIGYYQTNILCEQELSKLYEFFNDHTSNSRKLIKRLKFDDEASANMLWSRLITKFNKRFIHKNNKQYTAVRIMPSMEIIQWPENIYFKHTFNSLTKDKYLDGMYGTFIIPLIKTGCSTIFNEVGHEGIEIVSCTCADGCQRRGRCQKSCRCKKNCVCGDVTLHINEFINFFYTSELEPIDIIGPTRLNLYVHVEYKNK